MLACDEFSNILISCQQKFKITLICKLLYEMLLIWTVFSFFSVLYFYEIGIQHRMQTLITNAPLKTIKEDEFQPITFQQVMQIVCMPFIGVILSVLLLIGEMLQNKFKNKHKN